MPRKQTPSHARTEIARNLARKLYDYKLSHLVNLSQAEKDGLKAKFSGLDQAEFDDVIRQVISARQYEQERVGWQAIPHDIAVLIFIAATYLLDLRLGVIAGVATLVLLESLFQFYFNRPLYRYLSALVWLTYPAYVFLAYILYQRGYERLWIIVIIALAWGGSFLLGMIARLPVRLILEAKSKGSRVAARHK
jgi:hypothetical protein